jgi:tetratricopeptide (TPR) repeat protein
LDNQTRAESLYASAVDAYQRGDIKVLQHYAKLLLALARQLNDDRWLGRAHNFLGGTYVYQGDPDAAEREYRTALEHYRHIKDARGIASSLIGIGSVYSELNLDFVAARTYFEEGRAVAREGGAEVQLAFAYANLGDISGFEGDYGAALYYSKEALALFERLADLYVASQLVRVAHYQALRAEYSQSVQTLHRAYAKLRRDQRWLDVANYFEVWFFIAIELGRFSEAARLLGFLEWYRDERNVPRLPSMMPWFAPRLEKLEARLGYDEMMRLRRDGELLSFFEANGLTERIPLTPEVRP